MPSSTQPVGLMIVVLIVLAASMVMLRSLGRHSHSDGARAVIRTSSRVHTTPTRGSFSECVADANRVIARLSDARVEEVSILLRGRVRATCETREDDPFAPSGVYGVCADAPLPTVTLGVTDRRINAFSLTGTAEAEVIGSCKLDLVNLCAFPPRSQDVKRYPRLSMHDVIWTGALWIETSYPDVPYKRVRDAYGLSEYVASDGDRIVEADSVHDASSWFDAHTLDFVYITRCTIRLPAPTPLEFPRDLYRRKPLFAFNGFSTLRHQIWSSTIYSYVGPATSGASAPLIVLNNNAPPKTAHPDWLFSNVKFSAEIYGKFLPICLRGRNLCKVGFLHSSLSGKLDLEAKAVSLIGCYVLGIGTDDGKPLERAKSPLTKVLIVRNGPYASSDGRHVQNRVRGVIAPPRVVLDSTAFVCNAAEELTHSDYKTKDGTERHLPWTILNEGIAPPPILVFSVNLYWMLNAPMKGITDDTQASGGKIVSYGALKLTNAEIVAV